MRFRISMRALSCGLKTNGTNPFDALGAEEMTRLRVYFQQRHLLAHRQGIVDEEYNRRCGDNDYAVGQ